MAKGEAPLLTRGSGDVADVLSCSMTATNPSAQKAVDDVSRAAAAVGTGRVVFFPADLRSLAEISALFQSIQSYDFGPGKAAKLRPASTKHRLR